MIGVDCGGSCGHGKTEHVAVPVHTVYVLGRAEAEKTNKDCFSENFLRCQRPEPGGKKRALCQSGGHQVPGSMASLLQLIGSWSIPGRASAGLSTANV